MFNLLTGMTVGEYIRKRRLSLAGEEFRLLVYAKMFTEESGEIWLPITERI